MVFSFDVGATNPEYVVGADDVDKLIAVECIPMDDKGHQVFDQKLWIATQNLFYMLILIVYEIQKTSPDFLDCNRALILVSYLISYRILLEVNFGVLSYQLSIKTLNCDKQLWFILIRRPFCVFTLLLFQLSGRSGEAFC